MHRRSCIDGRFIPHPVEHSGDVFIILGNWTMVYFMFIKPMKD